MCVCVCVCVKRKQRVHVGKSEMFEKKQVEMCNFRMPCRVSIPTVERCRIVLVGVTMKEV